MATNCRFLALALFGLASLAQAQCPDTGRTVFYKQPNGIQGFMLLGDKSYRSFFVGSKFSEIEYKNVKTQEITLAPRPMFRLDGFVIQWILVERNQFMADKPTTPQEELDAYYKYETRYLTNLVKGSNATHHEFEALTPFEQKCFDGTTRIFLIWKDTLGKDSKDAYQYWVTTTHPQGVVVMSVIQKDPLDHAKLHLLIDSYMANFGGIDAKSCEKLQKDFPPQAENGKP